MNQSIRLSFFGAAGEVTGSCYLVETPLARVLVDFGLHQGGHEADKRNRQHPPIDARRLHAVVLTHAHIDHCGRLPLLVQNDYPGKVHCTPPTADIATLLLRDSAKIQEEDALRDAYRARRRGETAPPALYTVEECEGVFPMFDPLPYDEPREIARGITIRFVDAGHILGSASVEMRIEVPGRDRLTVFFSGDIGPRGSPLLRDFTPPRSPPASPPVEPDVVVMESTYGDRDHRPIGSSLDEFAGVVREAQESRGKVLVPAFAVGRTQNLVYQLGGLLREGKIRPVAVFVDSPMAVDATELYVKHRMLFDPDAKAVIEENGSALRFPGLKLLRTGEESRTLNDLDGPAIIIAASGMCTGGRIMHHLKHHLWRVGTHIVIAGYQAAGSVGRQLVDGAQRVMVMGEPIIVRAKVHTIGGFSAHAGQGDLLRWAAPLKGTRARLFLTHGERAPRQVLALKLRETVGIEPELPEYHQSFEL